MPCHRRRQTTRARLRRRTRQTVQARPHRPQHRRNRPRRKNKMKFTRSLLLVLVASSFVLGGCSVFQEVGSWFASSGKKSNLRGVRIPVLTAESELKVDTTLAKTPVMLPQPYRNPEWPLAGGYASNAMYHLDVPGRLRKIWDQDAGKGSDRASLLTSPPVVGGGLIFALDSEAHVWVFRAGDGHPVWNKRLAPKNGTDMPTLWGVLGTPNTVDPPQGMGGGVAYDDGKIFVTSGFGVLHCMDARTGREIWNKNMGMPVTNAPVVNGGRIFVSTHDNHFYAMAETDGRTLWEHQGIAESQGMLASTSAAIAGETVIAPYTSGEVYALRAQNGQVGWSDVLSRSGPVPARRYCRAPGDRPRRGLCHQPVGRDGGLQRQYGRAAVDARHRRHPDA